MQTGFQPNVRLRSRRLILPAILLLAGALGASAPDVGAKEFRRTKRPPRIQNRIELGRRLFFEPRLSLSGMRSCASCHAPDHGFSDPDMVSTDDSGTTGRHSQTLLDSAFNPSAHWDGEFPSVEALITQRLGGRVVYYGGSAPITPRRPPVVTPRPVAGADGVPTHKVDGKPVRRRFLDEIPGARNMTSAAANGLQMDGRYADAFRAVFGKPEATIEHVALALAAYCYSIESTEAPFDRYRQGDKRAISRAAKRGMLLFEGRAGCAQCHTMTGTHPLFTDFAFHNTGVTWNAMETHRSVRLVKTAEGAFVRRPVEPGVGEPAIEDRGVARITGKPVHERRYKTPTLRDATRRGPYMHDGRFADLAQVVQWYADGCGNDEEKDARLEPFACSEQDAKDLVAFLETLTGDERPGRATKVWSRRAVSTRLRIMQGDVPVRDLDVKLVPVGGELPLNREGADEAVHARTNHRGEITYKPGNRTHMRVVLPNDIPTKDSPLVPDTCRSATIQVPLLGPMTFIVTGAADARMPPALVANHVSVPNLPTRRAPRTVFRRISVTSVDGKTVARYRGWVRNDLPPRVRLEIPGAGRGGGFPLTLEARTTRRIDLGAD